jgi:hypothetical protein
MSTAALCGYIRDCDFDSDAILSAKKLPLMPPSGYNRNQAESMTDFLRSCVAALISENRGIRTAPAAIQREVSSISRDLEIAHRAPFEVGLLKATKAFYEELLVGCPADLEDLTVHADECLAGLRARILEIHVEI